MEMFTRRTTCIFGFNYFVFSAILYLVLAFLLLQKWLQMFLYVFRIPKEGCIQNGPH